MNIPLMILLQIVLIALNAIFACAEIAVISTNTAKLEQLAAKGDRRAKRLLKLPPFKSLSRFRAFWARHSQLTTSRSRWLVGYTARVFTFPKRSS